MPTSDNSWSDKIRMIGDLERGDHWYLTPDDVCSFFGEYTARAGYSHSSTNQLIVNLKKSPTLRGTGQWRWKESAITDTGHAIARNTRADALAKTIIVPMPPSKLRSSPEYDDRMVRVAKAIGPHVDVREIITLNCERESFHGNQCSRDPRALRECLTVDGRLAADPPREIILLDDVITTGCSFKVCKALLLERWPCATVYGMFIARRVIDRSASHFFEPVIDLDDL